MVTDHRLLKFVLSFLAVALFGGCQTLQNKEDYNVARFYLEESPLYPTNLTSDMILPVSESLITVRSRPVMFEYDLAGATIVETELGRALMFMLTPAAGRDFYRLTINNQGKRLVVTINGIPLGAHYIDRPVEDGRFLLFLEVDDDELEPIADGIQKVSDEVRKATAR